MPSTIRANRPYVDDKFSVLGFTIHTGLNPAWYEVALATDPTLFEAGSRQRRTASNFFSTRGQGPLSAERGESVYLVPPSVLAHFAGSENLYYALATFRGPDWKNPEIVRLPAEIAPPVHVSRAFTGTSRRLPGPSGGPTTSYTGNGASLEWAGDAATPGMTEPVHAAMPGAAMPRHAATPATTEPVHPAAPEPEAAPAPPPSARASALDVAYSDGFEDAYGPVHADDDAEDSRHGIDGPVPDDEAAAAPAQATALDAPAPEYPGASRFEPAAEGNYRHHAAARQIDRIVIHITDGGSNINGTISWFKDPRAKVSAHYVVGQDGEVVQMVRDDDVAYHAHAANGHSIGIEHVANSRGLMPTTDEYRASARLVCWLASRHGVPVDRDHIVGHNEADPQTSHRGCPTVAWDWDKFMAFVAIECPATPAPETAEPAQTAALGTTSFDLDWPDVQLVHQMTNMSCWAAAAAMVVGWRDRVSIDPAEVASSSGHWAAYNAGLAASDFDAFANGFRLQKEPLQSYTIDAFSRLLETNGPLWVAAQVPFGHVLVVTGLYSEGGSEDTFVRILDPLDRAPGTPGNPGVYLGSHDHGSQYVLTWRRFVQEYEGVQSPAQFGDVQVQILHADGTDGRTPARGMSAATQALALENGRTAHQLQVPPIAIPIATTIIGAVITKVLNNQGDISWELDQLRGVKRPHDDPKQEGSGPYTQTVTLVEGPVVTTVSGLDKIYADFEITWEWNGRSIGNVAITRKKANDAIAAGLHVKAIIQDEANVYRALNAPGGDTFAAIHIVFDYDFSLAWPQDDMLADRIFTLYANGDVSWTARRWTQ